MKSTFNYSFVFWLIIFILFSYAVLSYIPDFYLEKYQTSVYMESGQIGDIVGGTTNPIIAIVAAFLTFLAFWMQYRANKQQREDISLERFENNLYEMLHMHRENLFDLSCGKDKGKVAVVRYCYKLRILYFLIDNIVEFFSDDDKDLFLNYCDENNYSRVEAKTIISYNLFFYGANFVLSFDERSKYKKLYDKICRVIEAFELERVKVSDKGCYNEYSLNILYDNIIDYFGYAKLSNAEQLSFPDALLCGYNEKLGVYYRQLYQIAKMVALKEAISEDKRYEYMRILRSQLSDYEQILLYYNGITPIGKAWNECLIADDLKYKSQLLIKVRSCFIRIFLLSSIDNHLFENICDARTKKCRSCISNLYKTIKIEWNMPSFTFKVKNKDYWKCKMGLVARFRLIKNLPVSFNMFGYIPDSKYINEIIAYKKHNDSFFETKQTTILGDSI